MSTSIEMDELRKIRDDNSQRHINMTKDERRLEAEKSISWFVSTIGKPINVLKDKK